MRISRKKRPDKPLIPKYFVNERIRTEEVRVLDSEGGNLGVMKTRDAIAKAKEEEKDLVEINPKADPPVAKIMNFTQFKYQKEKEVRKQKLNSHIAELKGIRLSMRISEGDMKVRLDQALKFLNRGDKVRTEVILRGREKGKSELGFDVIRRFCKMIEAEFPIRFEQEVTAQGGKITAIVTKK
jgi:translation initiation factor IF-3